MNSKRRLWRVLVVAARVVGFFWILGGIVFVLGGVVAGTDRAILIGIGVFLLIAGVGLVIAKSPFPQDLEKIRRIKDRLKG